MKTLNNLDNTYDELLLWFWQTLNLEKLYLYQKDNVLTVRLSKEKKFYAFNKKTGRNEKSVSNVEIATSVFSLYYKHLEKQEKGIMYFYCKYLKKRLKFDLLYTNPEGITSFVMDLKLLFLIREYHGKWHFFKSDVKTKPNYVKWVMLNKNPNHKWITGLTFPVTPFNTVGKIKTYGDYMEALGRYYMPTLKWNYEELRYINRIIAKKNKKARTSKTSSKTIKFLNNYISDSLHMAEVMQEDGFRSLDVSTHTSTLNAYRQSKRVHLYWKVYQKRIAAARAAELANLPCPGENFIPELEDYRIKFAGEMVSAGNDLKHCLGLYAENQDVVHYRYENAVCQVNIERLQITQCYDYDNKITENSKWLEQEVSKYLNKLKQDKVDF